MAKTYITTSIAYINAEPHIGFLLELIGADVIARIHRQKGDDVFFLTGTDEHGLKIQQAAEAAKQAPQEFADKITAKFVAVAEEFAISNDYFIRTTDPKHVAFIEGVWGRLLTAGVLEKRSYTGLYCTGCEAFKTEREVKDGQCLIHHRALEKVEEENYFLTNIPEQKDKIKAWIETAVYPESRRHEALNMLAEFEDVSVSRSKEKLSWGVPVPGDESQTMYVWVDALFNYLSGIELSGRKIDDFWPVDLQIIGIDILKFHAIIWPALLLATNYDLPKKLLVHGFINSDGKKMSKSLGNVISPDQLEERYGVDGTRYLLLRQLNFYEDSNFSWEEFDSLYNGELANGIGNLVARSIGLAKKTGLKLHYAEENRGIESELDFRADLEEINHFINDGDAEITEQKLWEETEKKEKVLSSILERLWLVSHRLEPYMPSIAPEIRRQLGELDSKPLFPRIEKKRA